jgi:hypothetical protein
MVRPLQHEQEAQARVPAPRRRLNPRALLTIAVLLAVLALVALRSNQWRLPSSWNWTALGLKKTAVSPEDAVYAMLDAARVGDVRAYLDCFSGSLKDQLVATVRESTEGKFKSYLTTQNAAFQSIAVMVTDRGDTQAIVRLEYVYKDRNEVQNVELKKEGTSWKISNVEGAQPIRTLIPYGTPVTD